jgi:hypothetical protein
MSAKIEIDAIKKVILIALACVGVGTIVAISAIGALHFLQAQPDSATNPVQTGVPQTQQYPYLIEFTVLSTGVTNGHYEVITTTGQILFLSDFNTWNVLYPQNTYSGTVTGAETNGALDVGTVNLVSAPNPYTVYYHYSLYYYAYDGRVVTPATWNDTIGHRVIEGMPPYLP